ncbi:M56 family metallopeptidase [Dethiothermospora halolimnae]|uniref:M56 family metallopeptidase n=1 Tax=Dethiothermospora halolimnae TaxID=3114390 RepID=UPI003CCC1A63
MNETIKFLLSLSLSGSIIGVLIFTLKPFIKHRLSKKIQYYIWIIVLLRLITPFSVEDSIMNDVFYSNKAPVAIEKQNTIKPMEITSNNIIISTPVSKVQENIVPEIYNDKVNDSRGFIDILNKYAVSIWILGLMTVLLGNLSGYIRFLKQLKTGYRPATDKENKIFYKLLNGRKGVKLVRNRFVTTPMLIGLFKPYIIIPDVDFNEKQLKNILLHEISHLRHFDIGIKWLTMVATSIHWFNPFMHFFKKEINHACELACDEAVIKKLNSSEKQDYGDTLISVIAEHKYSTSVLQATMCEEKKTLKERLIAIMNHSKKSKLIIFFSIILLGFIIFGSLFLGVGVNKEKSSPPNITIRTEGEKTKEAQIGSYSWRTGDEHIQADSDIPINFQYRVNNIVSTSSKEQLIIETEKLKKNKEYDFKVENIVVYKGDKEIEIDIESRVTNSKLYIQSPPDSGEYIYTLELNFKNRGIVTYGFVVRVNMMTYDLEEISKYKTPYLGNHIKTMAIAGLLPVPDRYFIQRYTSMETSNRPYGLTIYYEAKSPTKDGEKWPILTPKDIIKAKSKTNALVAFSMIDNLDELTFAFRNTKSDGILDKSKYNTKFKFERSYFEEKYGNLSKLSNDLDLLKDILTDKKIIKGVETEEQFSQEIIDLVEENLKSIMSSPKESSNPRDYVKAHEDEYEDIIKYGGEEALKYMLSQFHKGDVDGLRGQLMMTLCKELLGQRDNVTDETLSPMEWFQQLDIREEVILPDFSYKGDYPIEKLVYETEIEKKKNNRRGGFTIIAPHIFGSYKEENKLKVFVTTYSIRYKLYDKVLVEDEGSIIPVSITYVKNDNGNYSLDEYQQAMDGAYFTSSIKEFCVLPVSGKNIKGLADEILNHYGNRKDIAILQRENLIKHLKENNQYGVSLYEKNYENDDELIPLT